MVKEKKLKTPLKKLEYMREYYKTEKYREWHKEYQRKKYNERRKKI